MITPLGERQNALALSGFEFSIGPDIPARNFLPEGENSIPSVVHDLNNMLNLPENHGLVA
jgi:hypothetical protein